MKELDPDIIVTHGGDSYLFIYLLQRATTCDVLDKFILSRDEVPFAPRQQAEEPSSPMEEPSTKLPPYVSMEESMLTLETPSS